MADSSNPTRDLTAFSEISLPNPYYFHLVNSDPIYPFDIIGFLPEAINLGLTAHWDEIASDFLTAASQIEGGSASFVGKGLDFLGSTASAALKITNQAKNLAGFNYQSDFFNSKIWNRTDPISFTLRVLFEAQNDAYNEVWVPINQLLSLTLPIAVTNTNDTGLGATIQNAAVDANNAVGNAVNIKGHILRPPSTQPALGGGKSNISVRIGNMYFFTDIIVDAVNPTFNTMLDRVYHLPISGSVDITLSGRRVSNFQDMQVNAGITPTPANGSTSTPTTS